jgi:hypothetical protein
LLYHAVAGLVAAVVVVAAAAEAGVGESCVGMD